MYSQGTKTQAFLYRMLFRSALMSNSRSKRGVLKNFFRIGIGGLENEKHRPCKMESKMKTNSGNTTPYVEHTCVPSLSQHDIPNDNYVCVNIRHNCRSEYHVVKDNYVCVNIRQKKLIGNQIVDVGVGCELRCKGHDCVPFHSNIKKKRVMVPGRWSFHTTSKQRPYNV